MRSGRESSRCSGSDAEARWPVEGSPGGGRRDRFQFRTGTQWVRLPERYGNWRGVCNRLRMWAVDGTWERVFTALMAQADADEELARAVSVDSTIVRAHQHAAGARKKRPRPTNRPTSHRSVPRRADRQDPPRSRCPLPTPCGTSGDATAGRLRGLVSGRRRRRSSADRWRRPRARRASASGCPCPWR